MQVRPARSEDKDGILAFCQDTFDWGDYIADVWDDWLADRHGRMLVAAAANGPVGLIHIALLEERVAWMEGMRIHPDHRRHGVASLLDRAAREFAREQGSLVARLATSIKNIPAQGVLAREGYTRVAQFNFWSASPAKDAIVQWRVATKADVSSIVDIWAQSQVRNASHGLLPTPRWTWTDLNEMCAQNQVEQGQVRLDRNGFAVVIAEDGEEPSALNLHAVVGADEALPVLARSARAEAGYRGYESAQALIAENDKLNDALEREGFAREGAILIYEQAL